MSSLTDCTLQTFIHSIECHVFLQESCRRQPDFTLVPAHRYSTWGSCLLACGKNGYRRDRSSSLVFSQTRCMNQDKSRPLISPNKTASTKKTVAKPKQVVCTSLLFSQNLGFTMTSSDLYRLVVFLSVIERFWH